MTPGARFVGLDLGTSALKAVVLDEQGAVLAAARRGYRTARPLSGRAEQQPSDWHAAVVGVFSDLPSTIRGGVMALGLTGMIPTLVTLDEARRPVGPAVTWEDGRAQAEGERLRGQLGADDLHRRTGQWLDGRYLLPQFRWLVENQPERARLTRWVVGAKDLLFLWLTGQLATDPSTATGFGAFDIHGGSWDSELCQAMGVSAGSPCRDRPGLPEVIPSSGVAPLIPAAARQLGLPAGIPVAVGGADSVVGALAAGANRPGAVAHLAGSSTVIMGISREPRWDPDHRWIVTPLAGQPGWGLETDLLSTGSSLAWLAEVMGARPPGLEEILKLAYSAPLGARGVVCLAHFGFGEQADLWDPNLMGLFANLTLDSGRADLARALLEGIMVSTRRCVDLVGSWVGDRLEPIYCGGWGASDARFRQLLADSTQRLAIFSKPSQPGFPRGTLGAIDAANLASAIGAAAIAGLGAGGSASGRGIGRRLSSRPDPSVAAEWAEVSSLNHRWRVQTGPLFSPVELGEQAAGG